MEHPKTLRTKWFGMGCETPLSEGRLDAEKAEELLRLCDDDAMRTAAILKDILPHAGRDWLYGAADWAKRGHAVAGVGVLMYSVIHRLRGGASPSAFSYDESLMHMWPTLIPLGCKIAVAIPAATDPSNMKTMLNTLANPSVRRTLASVDEDNSVVPDARSQIMLSQAGLIASSAGSGVTVWRLTEKPIGKAALESISTWYKEAVTRAVSGLEPVALTAKQMEPYLADAMLLIAAGETSRQVGPPAQVQKDSGLGSLLRRVLGGTRMPGVSLWRDPWQTQEVLRHLADT